VAGRAVCGSCGTEFVFPPLDRDTAIALQEGCKVHDESGRAAAYAVVEAGLRDRIRIPGAALDIGCGAGPFMAVLRKRGWNPIGVDVNEGAIAAARDRGFDVRLGSIDAAPTPANGFDAAVLMCALEYFSEPIDTLEQVHRRLRSGGVLALETPNARYHRKQAALGKIIGIRRERLMFVEPVAGRRLTAFTPESIRLALARAGFDEITIVPGVPRAAGGPAERAIRRLVFRTSLVLFHLSAGRLNVCPSMIVFATRR
jgi:SAM-dependent methyltransferase